MENSSRLSWRTKIGFGCGHVLNDMFGSMWYSYTLLYFNRVLRLGNTSSGVIVLIGQIADALFTALAGVLSDLDYDCSLCIFLEKRQVIHQNMPHSYIVYFYGYIYRYMTIVCK